VAVRLRAERLRRDEVASGCPQLYGGRKPGDSLAALIGILFVLIRADSWLKFVFEESGGRIIIVRCGIFSHLKIYQ
jgi:hypothetical protein